MNIFSLLCEGTTTVSSTASLGQLIRFGGPILYLIVYSFVLLAILFWAASGSVLPRGLTKQSTRAALPDDVAAEAEGMDNSNDLLRVDHVSKRFHKKTVVDNVSFGVPQNTIFAMLGPNGAGKTTTFNMIRECPDTPPQSLADIIVKVGT